MAKERHIGRCDFVLSPRSTLKELLKRCQSPVDWSLIYMVLSPSNTTHRYIYIEKHLYYRNIPCWQHGFFSTLKKFELANIVFCLPNVHRKGLQRRVSDYGYGYDPIHFWTVFGITCNKHFCEAFIQIEWVLFFIAMYRSSGFYPIICPAM